MEEKLNNLFLDIKNKTLNLIKEKNIDIDVLSFKLGIDSDKLISNYTNRIDDFSFYLKTLELVTNWEE